MSIDERNRKIEEIKAEKDKLKVILGFIFCCYQHNLRFYHPSSSLSSC